MDREKVLIVAEGCPHCESLKRKLEKLGVHFKILDVTKDIKAAKIVNDLELFMVPLFVEIRHTKEGETYCLLDQDGSVVKCVKASSLEV